MEVEGKTYEAAGVSLALADSIVERLRAAVESTGTNGFGAFAGLYPLDERAVPRGLDGQRGHEARARAQGRTAALRSAPTWPRTA